jgi:hypothetical protein
MYCNLGEEKKGRTYSWLVAQSLGSRLEMLLLPCAFKNRMVAQRPRTNSIGRSALRPIHLRSMYLHGGDAAGSMSAYHDNDIGSVKRKFGSARKGNVCLMSWDVPWPSVRISRAQLCAGFVSAVLQA